MSLFGQCGCSAESLGCAVGDTVNPPGVFPATDAAGNPIPGAGCVLPPGWDNCLSFSGDLSPCDVDRIMRTRRRFVVSDDDDTGKVSTHPKERRSSRPAEAKSPSGAPSSKKGTSERPAAKEPAAEPAPAQGKPFPAGILLALVAVVAVVIYFVAFRSGGGRDEAAGAELPSMGSPTGSAAPEPEAPAPEPATALDDAGSPEEASVDAGAATTASPTTPEETKPAPRVVRVTTTPTGALVKYRMTTETSPATLEIRPIDKSAVLFITLPGHRAVRHVVKPTDFADVDGAPVAEVSVELVPFVAKPAKPAAPKPATGGTAAEQSSMPPPANLVGGGTESAPAPKEAAPKEPAPSSDPTPAPAPKAPESAPPAESPATP